MRSQADPLVLVRLLHGRIRELFRHPRRARQSGPAGLALPAKTRLPSFAISIGAPKVGGRSPCDSKAFTERRSR